MKIEPDQPESNVKGKEIAFEVDADKLDVLIHELSKANAYMESIDS
jgi:hypothetical protein